MFARACAGPDLDISLRGSGQRSILCVVIEAVFDEHIVLEGAVAHDRGPDVPDPNRLVVDVDLIACRCSVFRTLVNEGRLRSSGKNSLSTRPHSTTGASVNTGCAARPELMMDE